MKQPVVYQRIEAGLLFLLSLYLYLHLGYHLLWFVLLLFTVDIFMLGYLVNRSISAHLYNLGHSFIIPPILLIVGIYGGYSLAIAAGLIWSAHIAWDRAFGYGLKFATGFKDTHLGHLGK